MPTSRSYQSYLVESLKDPQEAAAYLDAVLQDGDSVAQEQQPRRGRPSLEGEAKVNGAIDQIMQHNSTPKLPREQMWAVSLAVLKRITKASQAVIQRVLQQRKDEIEQHHQLYGLGKYHNALHRKTGTDIMDVVKP